MTEERRLVPYRPNGRVLGQYFWDRGPVSVIQGPVGSGTSSASVHRIWRQSQEQRPDRNGNRRTRWYIVRNTFSELKQTSLKTWKDWFEIECQGVFGQVKMTNPPEHIIDYPLKDGTRVMAEVVFLALDNADDVRKLLSAEITGVWFNEVQFTDKKIFDAARARAAQGRYPPKRDGGPTWKGIIADLNAPEEGHWIPYLRGDLPLPEDWDEDKRKEYKRPDDWSFYVQPPGLIEVIKDGVLTGYLENTRPNRVKMGLSDVEAFAENLKWIDTPYTELIKGQSKSYIDTYVMNRVGYNQAGNPVYQGFQRDIHVARENIPYDPNLPLIVGLDFARNPAMVVCQFLREQLRVLDEFGVDNAAATTYAPIFRQRLFKKFPMAMTADGGGIQFYGDPTGNSKGQGTDITPFMIFKKNGMMVIAAPGNNNIDLRINAVQGRLNAMIDGRPGILVDPRCVTINSGFSGQYHYSKIKSRNADGSAQQPAPNKHVRAADYHDALQYAALGAGLGVDVLTGGKTPKPAPMRQRKRFSLRGRV